MRCIYVLHCPTARKTYYKIGKTTNLKQRLRGYNSYLIWGYKVVFRLELPDATDKQLTEAEKVLHDAFNHCRIKRRFEWFRLREKEMKQLKSQLEQLEMKYDAQLFVIGQ